MTVQNEDEIYNTYTYNKTMVPLCLMYNKRYVSEIYRRRDPLIKC